MSKRMVIGLGILAIIFLLIFIITVNIYGYMIAIGIWVCLNGLVLILYFVFELLFG